jgi:hypothetical protein
MLVMIPVGVAFEEFVLLVAGGVDEGDQVEDFFASQFAEQTFGHN